MENYIKDTELNLVGSNENINEPRIKGKSVINDEEFTEIKKGVFTSCKKRDGCPAWKISSEKIKHDKKNKIINYENAKFYIYDFPILYLPRFYYPDPTVKRQSGFLIPSFQDNSTAGLSLTLPYFLAMAENRDITLTPRFFNDDKLLLQSEFRQKNLKSSHITDFSFFTEKDEETKSHFFYEFDKILTVKNFDTGQINFKSA